ncbi:MAG: efflux RND transporter periplasmic adaptor subunit [Deltaproteobacteria bacterium]|nr:efflux RND transporter periplasmic adaptor subunit [Deltaproteobacteria bacterium]
MRMGVVLVFTLLLAATACSSDEPPATSAAKPVADVRVKVLSADGEGATFTTVGRVKDVRESVLAGKVMGMVNEVRVKAGDAVKKGQLLMRIDDRDVLGGVEQARGALAQAEAALSIAETNFKRFDELRKKGSASPAEFDKARFEYESARGAVKTARGAVATAGSLAAEARVTAPFDGQVVDTMIEQGEMVSPGRPLLKIEGASELEFETTVDERDVGALAVGQEVDVSLDVSRDERTGVRGAVSEIVPASDTGTHTTIVRIRLDGGADLRSGTFGRARFPRSGEGTVSLTVPEDRIVRHGQLSAVFVVDEADTVRLRLVREGRTMGGDVEILAGLRDGARLVVSDISSLIDGQPARVTE